MTEGVSGREAIRTAIDEASVVTGATAGVVLGVCRQPAVGARDVAHAQALRRDGVRVLAGGKPGGVTTDAAKRGAELGGDRAEAVGVVRCAGALVLGGPTLTLVGRLVGPGDRRREPPSSAGPRSEQR